MGKGKRKRYAAEFKAKVDLEAMKGEEITGENTAIAESFCAIDSAGSWHGLQILILSESCNAGARVREAGGMNWGKRMIVYELQCVRI